MKAVQISEYGDPSVLKLVDIEKPPLKDGQVLVEVRAASLNPFDTTIRAGYMKDMIPLQFPVTIGGDIAGVITDVGSVDGGLSDGDKVYGHANVTAGNSGAFAEYAATSAGGIAKMPSNLDFKQAASLALVGVSALQALRDHINLQPGQKILIHGGSGGIGTVAVQMAKYMGAYVTTTAPTEALEYVKGLGADEVIDYKTQDFQELVHDYDAVFDTVGGDVFEKSFKVLKKGGIAVSMIAQADEAVAKEHGITAISQQTHVITAQLNTLTKLIEDSAVTPHIAKVFPLDQVKAAFETREGESIFGKVVLELK